MLAALTLVGGALQGPPLGQRAFVGGAPGPSFSQLTQSAAQRACTVAAAAVFALSPLSPALGEEVSINLLLNEFTDSKQVMMGPFFTASSSQDGRTRVAHSAHTVALTLPTRPQVANGMRQAGITAKDARMINLWSTLKEARLVEAGAEAADLVQPKATADAKDAAQALAAAQTQVRGLQPYLEELQNDLIRGRWKFVGGYVGIIFAQRPAIQVTILNSYAGDDSMMAMASKDAMVDEGNRIFERAEALSKAAARQNRIESLNAYAKLALSYDRFLKAADLYGKPAPVIKGSATYRAPKQEKPKLAAAPAPAASAVPAPDGTSPSPAPAPPPPKAASGADPTLQLVPQYDALTSTEALYKNTPQSALQVSSERVKITDRIVVVAGPDKGRTGVLLGLENGETAIIKLSTKELKVIDILKIAKANSANAA